MKLGVRLLEALVDIDCYRRKGYPAHWKAKSREKLERLGLVVNQHAHISDAIPSYVLTEAGRKVLEESKGR